MQRNDANQDSKAASSSVGGMRTRSMSPKMKEVLLQCRAECVVSGSLHASGAAAYLSTRIPKQLAQSLYPYRADAEELIRCFVTFKAVLCGLPCLAICCCI